MKILYLEKNQKANNQIGELIVEELKEYGVDVEILLVDSIDAGFKRLEKIEPEKIEAIICGTFGDRSNAEGKFLGKWTELANRAKEKGIGFTLITGLPLGEQTRQGLEEEAIGVIDKGKFEEGLQKFCENLFTPGKERLDA